MPLSVLQEFSGVVENDVYSVLSLEGSLAARDHIGGTAPKQVKAAIERAKRKLADR